MGIFQKFPYTDDHQLNLNWILRLFTSFKGGSINQVLAKRSNKDYDFKWVNQGGGGGSSDYNDLSNKPQINSVELSGNKTLSQLGINIPSAGTGTPAMDGTGSAGSSSNYARADHVHPTDTSRAAASSVHSIPSGGSSGQYLAKSSNSDYDVAWVTGGSGGPSPYTSSPASLGTASPGVSDNYARGDHVHPMPSATDVGAEPAVTEVTISTAGAVTQALDAGKIYHFTGSLTALTVTASNPTTGKYQFDFTSGSTAPTLTVPSSWVMPDNFLVEPNARYSLTVENGYCSLKKWSDSHSPFIYLDSTAGDFVMNSSDISEGKVFANVGTEVEVINIDVILKNQLSNNTWLKICDISASSKALMGSTYVSSYLAVGNGKITMAVFNTWQTSSEIRVKNNTGSALDANTQLSGAILILRTL